MALPQSLIFSLSKSSQVQQLAPLGSFEGARLVEGHKICVYIYGCGQKPWYGSFRAAARVIQTLWIRALIQALWIKPTSHLIQAPDIDTSAWWRSTPPLSHQFDQSHPVCGKPVLKYWPPLNSYWAMVGSSWANKRPCGLKFSGTNLISPAFVLAQEDDTRSTKRLFASHANS